MNQYNLDRHLSSYELLNEEVSLPGKMAHDVVYRKKKKKRQNNCFSPISFNFSVCNEYMTPQPSKSVGKVGFSQQHVKVGFELYSSLKALLFLSTRGSCVRNSASCVLLQNIVLEELRCQRRSGQELCSSPNDWKIPQRGNAEVRMLLMTTACGWWIDASQLLEGDSDLAQVWRTGPWIKKEIWNKRGRRDVF